ncbi:putative carboxysome-related structural protein with putative role in ethanolamine utilization [uncultured spirochete]|jgi:ethanolamine utilization protein EutL|uniref:Putative carboxysome-related structural protein with putative role in ethanolamine utilization n=1 Tax=uncultured spirochete TaxID=156406 RepID=A0A3P3XI78_9SPIR|nr:ethanolamine utilization microcompartment protein EutL [Rectinema subterraneum]SLM12588.1 putative carboxysome-related structural protein with putative role in ethanolamine utilization [uncultured spirochete]HBE45870.1 ethanolamine utilization microcompartment protein EutL [Spirochaetaceae bacterium]HCX96055.1 ethanolamine utilization microcompartment protein EutL [Spirochaetaceae bacterium]
MSVLDPIFAHALAVRIIPKVSDEYARAIGLEPSQTSLGFITADNDDALYVSIDEATKMADVEVVYAHSFYAGARHSSGIYSGEIIAMLAGPDPTEVKAGLDAAIRYLETRALWYSADAHDGVAFFPHVVSRIGSYLASVSGLPEGASVAYLVAPPLEGSFALDAALKAAAVRIAAYTAPPSETNFMGAILTGEQSACEAAALTFQEAVLDVAQHPIMY